MAPLESGPSGSGPILTREAALRVTGPGVKFIESLHKELEDVQDRAATYMADLLVNAYSAGVKDGYQQGIAAAATAASTGKRSPEQRQDQACDFGGYDG